MSAKQQKKGSRFGMVPKILIAAAAVLVCVAGCGCWHVLTRMGHAPDEAERARLEKYVNYRDGKFLNLEPVVLDEKKISKGAGFFRFIFAAPHGPKKPYPRVELLKGSFPEKPEEFNVCWLGHSSLIFELGNRRFMVDPVFGNAAPFPGVVRRAVPSPLPREEIPELDFVLISHDHYDHLEYETVRSFRNRKFPIVTSLGVGARLRGWGIPAERIIELNWNSSVTVAGVRITAHPARHFSGRGLKDRYATLWSSFSFERNGRKIFFGADSGYGRHFAAIGREYGPFDLVCLEIDAWNKLWPNNHSFPEEAIQEFKELRGKRLLPIHWGVFDLAMHPYYESVNMVRALAEAHKVPLLLPAMGERKRLP